MNRTYGRLEVIRSFRSVQFLVFALGTPLIFFFVLDGTYRGDDLGRISSHAYIMVSMATFGAMSPAFGMGGRIAVERTSGWNRQLRLTSMRGRDYVAGKIVGGFAVGLPSMLLVFLVGAALGHVHLGVSRWALVVVAILLSLVPIAILGVWLGYILPADNVQMISSSVYALLALLGGLWIPVAALPSWLEHVCKASPVFWTAEAGRRVLEDGTPGWRAVAVLLAWAAVFAVLADRAYRRDVKVE